MILLYILIPAVVYFAVLLIVAVKRGTSGIGISLLFFVLAVSAGYWSVIQSRSSTAALGLIGLPLLGAIAGFLGLTFGRWALGSSDQSSRKSFGWIALVCAVGLVGFTLFGGARRRVQNDARDQTQAEFRAEMYRNRELIAGGLASNPGRERAYMDSSIRARLNDRAFLLAALHNDSISPGILDTLANSEDGGVALEAVRNPATSSETLTRVYETKTNPSYFYQAIAGHANTPPDILRKLYADPGMVSPLDIWLAGNPSAPRDVLAQIAAKSTDRHVLDRLVQNPALDCALLRETERALGRLNLAADDYSVVRVKERVGEAC